MTVTHKFPMSTVSFDLTTSGTPPRTADIGTHGDQIVAGARIDDSTVARIDVGLLEERHTDTPDHSDRPGA